MTAFLTVDFHKFQTAFIPIVTAAVIAIFCHTGPAFSQEDHGMSDFLEDLDTSLDKTTDSAAKTEINPEMNSGTAASTPDISSQGSDNDLGNSLDSSGAGASMPLDSPPPARGLDSSAAASPSTSSLNSQEAAASSSSASTDPGAGLPKAMDSMSSSTAPSNSGSMSSAPHMYKMLISFDLPKGDLFNAKGVTISQCLELCDKEKACSAVTYDRWNRYCFAKNVSRSSRRLFVQAKSDTYVLQDEISDVSISSSTIEIKRRRGKGFSGTPNYTAMNASYENCKTTCRADQKCAAFNHIPSKNLCEFFFQPPEYFSKSGYQIGVKQQLQ